METDVGFERSWPGSKLEGSLTQSALCPCCHPVSDTPRPDAPLQGTEEGDPLLMVLLGLSILGLVIMMTSAFGAYAASNVSLSKLVWFFWGIVITLLPFTLFGFFCFDFQVWGG